MIFLSLIYNVHCLEHGGGYPCALPQATMSPIPDLLPLHSPGLMSGIAVALHNFPEGLATYAGTIADPTAGIGIAFAIALHNIPEVSLNHDSILSIYDRLGLVQIIHATPWNLFKHFRVNFFVLP